MKDLPKKVIGIILTEKTVTSFLLAVDAEKIKTLVSTKPFDFDSKNLINRVDESLQELGPESEEVDEAVFVFDHHWHDGSDIYADRQKDVDRILKELSLKDLGFITLEETVAELLTAQNPDFSALVGLVSKTDVDVNVFRAGKQICHEIVGRSDDFRSDMIEAVARLAHSCGQKPKHLPHKFILLSLNLSPLELERLSQLLTEVDWKAHGLFLQLPQVETLPEGALLDQIAHKVGVVIQKHFITKDLGQVSQVKTESESAPVVDATSQVTLARAAVAQETTELVKETVKQTEEEPSLVKEVKTDSPTAVKVEKSDGLVSQSEKDGSKESHQKLKKSFLSWLNYHWHSMDDRSKKPFVLAGFILGVLVLLAWGYFLATKRFKLNIFIAPAVKTLTKELDVTLSETAVAVDPEKAILPAKPATETVEVSDVTQATGEKNVGEKAEGKVKLINKTTEEKTLVAGTKLISDDEKGLEFELTADATLPAATISNETDQETKTYGTVEVTVKAVKPGEEYNLPKDTKFKLADISTDEQTALALEDFSGGTSQTAAIVTELDLSRLKKRLLEEASKQAEEKFNKPQTAQMLFSPPTSQTVAKSQASHEVGEETDEVKLTLTVKVQALYFAKSDLLKLVKQAFESDLPAELELMDDDIEMLTKFATDKGQTESPVLVVSTAAKARYKLDLNQLKDQLAGRYLKEAESILKNNQKISSFEFRFSPSFSKRFVKKVPEDQGRFSVIIK